MTGYFPPEPHQTQGSLEQARILEAQNRGAGGSWMGFAGTFLILIGLLNLVWAIVALSKPEQFDETSLIWEDLRGTAWLLIPAGVLQIVAGAFVLARTTFGRIVAMFVASAGIIINFVTIDAHPLWSLIILVANALVLWAVTVHAHDEDFA